MKHFSAFCFLLLILLALPSNAQHLTLAQVDSLKDVLQQCKADTNRIRMMMR